MRKSTRMLLMNSGRSGPRERDRGPGDYGYERQYSTMGYEPDYRFRDLQGRERYDDGRYAPMSVYGGGYGDIRYPGDPYIPPIYERDNEYRSGGRSDPRPMNHIGFSVEGEMKRIPQDYETDRYGSERRSNGHKGSMRSGEEHATPFTKETAMEWTGDMENGDGSKGPHWSMEQVRQVMEQRGIDCDPLQFFAVLNSVYSDYCAVAKKHGVNKMDFYADLAKAWLEDPDAADNKAARYFEYIVKH